jgi:DNA replication protein DnaC
VPWALLILDDWDLEPLGPEQRHDMLEIVEDRYGRGATLITSQMPVDRWHDLIGEPTLADASTASSITPIASSSKATAYASKARSGRPPLDRQ